MIFVTANDGRTKKNFFPSSFCAVVRSEIRDQGSGMDKNQDPGSWKNIPDPQHWFCVDYC
jgi:hypothetical protein